MGENDLLDKNFKYYLDHQEEILKKFEGKVVIIKDEAVINNFDNYNDAYFYAKSYLEEGTYILQRCSSGNQDYSQTFHSRVVF